MPRAATWGGAQGLVESQGGGTGDPQGLEEGVPRGGARGLGRLPSSPPPSASAAAALSVSQTTKQDPGGRPLPAGDPERRGAESHRPGTGPPGRASSRRPGQGRGPTAGKAPGRAGIPGPGKLHLQIDPGVSCRRRGPGRRGRRRGSGCTPAPGSWGPRQAQKPTALLLRASCTARTRTHTRSRTRPLQGLLLIPPPAGRWGCGVKPWVPGRPSEPPAGPSLAQGHTNRKEEILPAAGQSCQGPAGLGPAPRGGRPRHPRNPQSIVLPGPATRGPPSAMSAGAASCRPDPGPTDGPHGDSAQQPHGIMTLILGASPGLSRQPPKWGFSAASVLNKSPVCMETGRPPEGPGTVGAFACRQGSGGPGNEDTGRKGSCKRDRPWPQRSSVGVCAGPGTLPEHSAQSPSHPGSRGGRTPRGRLTLGPGAQCPHRRTARSGLTPAWNCARKVLGSADWS